MMDLEDIVLLRDLVASEVDTFMVPEREGTRFTEREKRLLSLHGKLVDLVLEK